MSSNVVDASSAEDVSPDSVVLTTSLVVAGGVCPTGAVDSAALTFVLILGMSVSARFVVGICDRGAPGLLEVSSKESAGVIVLGGIFTIAVLEIVTVTTDVKVLPGKVAVTKIVKGLHRALLASKVGFSAVRDSDRSASVEPSAQSEHCVSLVDDGNPVTASTASVGSVRVEVKVT